MSSTPVADVPASLPEHTPPSDSQDTNGKASTNVPSDDTLLKALTPLRNANPSMGASKLHAMLLRFYPEWVGGVSEKRTRRVLGNAGLAAQGQGMQNGMARTKSTGNNLESINSKMYPSSRMLKDLDVSRWTDKVAVRDFGLERGKGLIATKDIEEGEVVWKEDPWVLTPEWEIYDLVQASVACAFCSTPFNSRRTNLNPVSCPSASSSHSSSTSSLLLHPCSVRFCNRLCLQRATGSSLTGKSPSPGAIGPHMLMCPSMNPASVPFTRFAREKQWLGIMGWAGCVIRVLLANEREGAKKGAGGVNVQGGIGTKDETVKDVMEFLDALAVMEPEERAKVPGLEQSMSPQLLRTAHQHFLNALKEPAVPQEKKKLARLLRTPLPEPLAADLFSYDAFVRGVIKLGLNVESHGGLYLLHSHLNHSCSPSLSARHLDASTCLSRVTLIARRKIRSGEELTVTYVNPEMDVRWRKRELLGWGIECTCERCVKEGEELEKLEKEKGKQDGEANGDEGGDTATTSTENFPGLEKELKEGLGLM